MVVLETSWGLAWEIWACCRDQSMVPDNRCLHLAVPNVQSRSMQNLADDEAIWLIWAIWGFEGSILSNDCHKNRNSKTFL